MLSITSQSRFFLAREPVDFRKAFDGLSIVIREALGLDPRTGDHFIFFNRLRNRVKIMVWDQNGFWLHYKRLEKGTFGRWWPSEESNNSIVIDGSDLEMILGGIDWRFVERRKHYVPSLRPIGSDGRGSTHTRIAQGC